MGQEWGAGVMATDGRRELARRGEDEVADHLVERGLEILCRNYRCPAGELDIVAREGETIVFVEVKARRSRGCGAPAEAVDRRKRARLVRVARWFLRERRLEGVACRFDVAGVMVKGDRAVVEWLTDAFSC